MEYTPDISEGYYPEDVSWATSEGGGDFLLLCVPQYSYLLTFKLQNLEYVWLYNPEIDAYIFCFRINHKFEHAIIFQKDHAGMFLQNELVNKPFQVIITHRDFDTLRETDPVFKLNDIVFTRHKSAGW